jgi:hypothetical protein
VNSPPYVHEQNGNAEKLFRDLGEMARAMMATTKLAFFKDPKRPWVLDIGP